MQSFSFRRVLNIGFALVGAIGLSVAAHAQQVKMSSAQQARTSDPANNTLQINNPSSNSTCVSGQATWAAGDFLVAVVTLSKAGAAETVTAPGFTQLGATRVANHVQQTVLYRALSSAPTSVNFNWGAHVPAVAVLYAFKNVNAATPFADPGSSAVDQANVARGPARTGVAGSMQVMVLADEGTSTQTMGNPTPTYPAGCDSTNGRYGRLIGSTTAQGSDRLSVGMYARPAPAGAIPSYTVPTIGTSNIGTTFVLRP